jgi:hypothetical protein
VVRGDAWRLVVYVDVERMSLSGKDCGTQGEAHTFNSTGILREWKILEAFNVNHLVGSTNHNSGYWIGKSGAADHSWHSFTKEDIEHLQTQLADALHWYSIIRR